jgi:UDP-N-acetylmuramoyl-tripeptide--D-alanyl-D-alanine ligase
VLVEVDDPLLALGRLGAWHRARFPVPLVAVTGSVGKTTTKDLTAAVLGACFAVLKSPGNLNAEVGLPLTLLELCSDHRAAVVEMAMRGSGQIRYLAEVARPQTAVITNIGLSHLELLGTQDAIGAAKAEVLDYLPNGGRAILNADDGYHRFLESRVPPGAEMLSFSTRSNISARIRGTYQGLGPESPTADRTSPIGSRFEVRDTIAGEVFNAWIPLPGRHNVANAMAALGAGLALGVPISSGIHGLRAASISSQRMSVFPLANDCLLLDDSYNASSPEAMHAALEVLAELAPRRRIAILADMLELGDASETAHFEVGRHVALTVPAKLVTVGSRSRLIAEAARRVGYSAADTVSFDDRDEALRAAIALLEPGDAVLVKGSRGMALEHLVSGLREARSD